MAYGHGKDSRIYVNGYNLGAFLQNIGFPAVADTAEVSTFGDSAKEYIPGMKDATLTADGMFGGASGESDVILNTALGASGSLWSYFPQGDALGAIGFGCECIHTAYDIPSTIGDAVKVNASAQVTGGRERGKSHHALTAETTDTNTASVDNAASSATGGVSYLHVTAFGGTDIQITIQHSSDDITFADLIVHTTVTAANSKERKTTAALTTTVNRYTRGEWDGDFTTCTFSLLFSRTPNKL